MKEVKLKDICDFYTGTGFPKEYQGRLLEEYPFFKVADIAENVQKNNTYMQIFNNTISKESVEKIKGTIVPEDTIIFAKIGEALKLNRRAITSNKCLIDNNCIGIYPRKSVLNVKYFYYFMKSIKLEDFSESTTVPSVRKSTLENIRINLFDLTLQKEIAKKLSSIEILINLKTNQLEKLDLLIKSRFVEMFGDIVINTKHYNRLNLKDVAPIQNFKGNFGEITWLLNLDMIESNTGKIINKVYANKTEIGNSTCTFNSNNVLYSKLRPYLNKVVLPDEEGYGTSELLPLLPDKEKINREYLAYTLRSDSFVRFINEKVAGAKMPRVSTKDLMKFKLPIPPLKLQNEFTDIVTQVNKSKFVFELFINSLLEITDGLKIF